MGSLVREQTNGYKCCCCSAIANCNIYIYIIPLFAHYKLARVSADHRAPFGSNPVGSIPIWLAEANANANAEKSRSHLAKASWLTFIAAPDRSSEPYIHPSVHLSIYSCSGARASVAAAERTNKRADCWELIWAACLSSLRKPCRCVSVWPVWQAQERVLQRGQALLSRRTTTWMLLCVLGSKCLLQIDDHHYDENNEHDS